jgi:polyisoprenoid-binding protein YceI
MQTIRIAVLGVLLAALTALVALAGDGRVSGKYEVDPVHSGVSFKIKHLAVSNVSGSFDDFSGKINIDYAHPAKSVVNFSVKAASVDTGNASRDEHLRSADFFDVAKYPEITFKSTKVAQNADGTFAVTGDLTLLGVTKSIATTVEQTGVADNEKRGPLTGFETEFKIKRTDFGMPSNMALGDEVKLSVAVEATLAKDEAAPPAK